MGLLFILTAPEYTNPENGLQAPLNVLFPNVHMLPVFYFQVRKKYSMLGGSFASFCCESDSSSCSSFLWAKGRDLECRPRGYWKAGLKLFPAEAPSCSFISVPWGAPALLSLLLSLLDTRGCTLRSSKESLQHLPSCNYPHVLQKMLVWRECEMTWDSK